MPASKAKTIRSSARPVLTAGISLNSPVEPNINVLNQYLRRIHKRGWYTNFGQLHEELTERLCDYLKVDNLLLVNNGTTALQVAAKALGLNHVVTTPYSFAATSSAMRWQKTTLRFADIDSASLNMSTQSLSETLDKNPNIDGILPVHIYGNPCDCESIEQLAKRHNVKVLYDAAQTFGVEYDEKPILMQGDASAISFHATKLFHTGEGGAIRFKHKSDLDTAKSMLNFGFTASELGPEGINGKMSEYHAAIGLTVLDQIEQIIDHRRGIFDCYFRELSDHVELPKWSVKAKHAGNYFAIILDSEDTCKKVAMALHEMHCQSRIYFQVPLHERYGTEQDVCPNTLSIINRTLTLPLHAHLSMGDAKRICEVVKRNV